MPLVGRRLTAVLAAATAVVLVANLGTSRPRPAKQVRTWVAQQGEAATCAEGKAVVIRVHADAVEYQGRPAALKQLEQQLRADLRNQAERRALVDADDDVAFAAVAQVISLLRRTGVEVAVAPPGTNYIECSFSERPVPGGGNIAELRAKMRTRAWWQVW